MRWGDSRPVLRDEPWSGDTPAEALAAENTPDAKKTIRRPGPGSCKTYMRKRLAKALPEIADALIAAAIAGDLPALKMLVQLSGLYDKETAPVSKRFGGRSFEEILLEDWRKEPLDGAATDPNLANGEPDYGGESPTRDQAACGVDTSGPEALPER